MVRSDGRVREGTYRETAKERKAEMMAPRLHVPNLACSTFCTVSTISGARNVLVSFPIAHRNGVKYHQLDTHHEFAGLNVAVPVVERQFGRY